MNEEEERCLAPSRRQTPRSRAFVLRDLVLDDRGSLHDQIYCALRSAILSGRVVAGTRLPTTRALAAELGVSRNTVITAFDALQAEGYVASRVGAGTFVAPQVVTRGEIGAPRSTRARAGDAAAGAKRDRGAGPRQEARSKPPKVASPRLSRYGRAIARREPRRRYDEAAAGDALAYDFRPCVPDLERLSYESWRRSVVRTAWSLPAADFDYGDPAGSAELRREIASYLGRARGIVCRGEEIVVVSGLAQALDLATRILVDAGESVLVEDPHYLGARRVFEAAGARLVGVAVDGQGLDLARVPRAQLDRCRLAYVTPSHQFPTGAVLSLARRQALLDWAERANGYVLEDDYDSEFRYAGRAIAALKSLDESDRVLYVGTFSKTLFPALRIAYVVLPPPLHEAFRTAKWLTDWSSPGFEQAVLARYLASGDFERHLRRARTCYSESRAALLESIHRELLPFEPELHDSRAGLHLLVRFPGLSGDRPFDWVAAGRSLGLGLYPVAPCHLARPPEALAFVMGFARLTPAAIRAGVGALARLLASGTGGRGEPSAPRSGKLGARGGRGAR
jgi:GntR family transcriptional regulator/MocR family aminotransferase